MPEVAENLMFRADAVSIPGRQVATADFLTIGPVQRIAYDSIYPPVDVAILLSPDFSEKLFFQRWQSLAVGYASHTDNSPPGMFKIGYYNDYAGSAVVVINQYDATGEQVYACKLVEAFPVTIGTMAANWNDTQAAHILVQFSYRYFVDDVEFLGLSQQQQNNTNPAP